MLVTEEQLENSLEQLAAEAPSPLAGVFGPGSAMWEVSRESLLLVLGGGRASLLQLAHPWVAHAIDQHSVTRADIAGRFQRTFDNVYAMIFGTVPQALSSARRVHRIHTRIGGAIPGGDRYQANDPGALLWVGATLWETSVLIYERYVRPMSPAEKQRYYEDALRFAALFGIPLDVMPRDWRAFHAYCRHMWANGLEVTPIAREMAAFLLAAPRPLLRVPMALVRLTTAGLLPPNLRDAFGLPVRLRDRAALRLSFPTIRRINRRLPGRLRYTPAYVDAVRRMQGKPPARTSALIQRGTLSLIARPNHAEIPPPSLASAASFDI